MRILIDPDGFVVFAGQRLRCALGKGGLSSRKREGDGATPVGEFALGRVFYRADKLPPPATGLRVVEIDPNMGWCDDPTHADYNTLIALPHPAHHEQMWRDDALYDVVVELLFNTNPAKPGLGSAIFLHVAKPDYDGTEGCIALKLEDLLNLLRRCNDKSVICVAKAGAS